MLAGPLHQALISLQTGPKGEHIESETGERAGNNIEEVITIISPRPVTASSKRAVYFSSNKFSKINNKFKNYVINCF